MTYIILPRDNIQSEVRRSEPSSASTKSLRGCLTVLRPVERKRGSTWSRLPDFTPGYTLFSSPRYFYPPFPPCLSSASGPPFDPARDSPGEGATQPEYLRVRQTNEWSKKRKREREREGKGRKKNKKRTTRNEKRRRKASGTKRREVDEQKERTYNGMIIPLFRLDSRLDLGLKISLRTNAHLQIPRRGNSSKAIAGLMV